MASAAADQGDAAAAGEPPPGVGHMHGGGLVADVPQAEARPEHGIENRHDVIAGQGEDGRRARALESANHHVGASDLCRHGLAPATCKPQRPPSSSVRPRLAAWRPSGWGPPPPPLARARPPSSPGKAARTPSAQSPPGPRPRPWAREGPPGDGAATHTPFLERHALLVANANRHRGTPP